MKNFSVVCRNENHWDITPQVSTDKILTLNGEFKKYWSKIERGENFALARYGDGERSLMMGREVHAQEGWGAGNEITELGRDLKNSLGFVDKNFVYAISCPCCDSEAYYWFMEHSRNCNVTFANIWVNRNFAEFYEHFKNLEREAVLITNYRGVGKQYGKLKIKKHYAVGDDCVKFWANEGKDFINKIIAEVGNEKNLLFAVSAGPMSGLFIKALYENNPDNCYIDFGSSLDIFTHKKITRPYMDKNSIYAKQDCWMFDNKKISFDVDVILSAYKRPEVLAQQLEAIKNQTLKPRRIFLYQDAVASDEKIVIDKNILNKFDSYEIAVENGGVWKRFEYAAKVAESLYICVFDDDTIPGNRWLENCHMNMQAFEDGVFGTNGVVLNDFANYPNTNSYINVGWHDSNQSTVEVDFVGHSWFAKREYLNWMIAKPYIKNFKYVGEDMCLSYVAQEHEIKTFVPQHPLNILSLWGSIPKYGMEYGNNSAALSINQNNLAYMRKAIQAMHNDGWRFLYERNPEYFALLIENKSLKTNKSSVSGVVTTFVNVMKFFGKKRPIFLGEKKFVDVACNLLNINPADYSVLEDENNKVSLKRTVSYMRPYAIHIFFTDIYDQLKPHLNKQGFTENEDYIDGRNILKIGRKNVT